MAVSSVRLSQLIVCMLYAVISLASCQVTLNNITSFEPNLPLQHMVLNKRTGDIYLGGYNYVYHLTSDLSLVAERSSLTADISNFCSSRGCIFPPEWEDNENKVLLIDKDNNFLIACGSAFNGTCVLHHLDSITTVEARVHDPVHHEEVSLGIGDSVIAFYARSIASMDRTDSMETTLFIGASFNPLFNDSIIRQHAVSTKRLIQRNSRWTFDLAYQNFDFFRFTYIDMKPEHVRDYPVKYINGFSSGGFSYFTTVQKVDVGMDNYHSRLVRICNQDGGYYSYTEVPLVCGSFASDRVYNLLQSAHVGPVGRDLAKRLKMKDGDMALFGLFAESSADAPDQPTAKTALCIYTIKKINKKISDGIQECFYNRMGSQGLRQFSDDYPCSFASFHPIEKLLCGTGDLHPIQAQATVNSDDYLYGGGHGHHYTSLSTTVMGRDTVAVMGTNSGHIHKYVIEPLRIGSLLRDYPLKPYKNIKLDTDGPVLRDMHFDSDEEHIYAMTPYKVYKIAMKTCEHHTHCSTCLTSSDPNQCGWCGGRCTTQEECENAEEGSGDMRGTDVDSEDGPEWVTDACSPAINEVTPVFGPVQGNTTVHIIGDSLVVDIAVGANATLEVTVAGQPCNVNFNSSNISHIICTTPPVEEPIVGPVTVEVEVEDTGLPFAIGGLATSEPRYIFSYVDPAFTHFSPDIGPMFGGTIVTLFGEGLNAGNKAEVIVAGVPCHVRSVTSTKIHCATKNSSEVTSGPVILQLDSLQLTSTVDFAYKENPYITDFSPTKSYLSGGNNLEIRGYNLHLGQNVQLEISAFTESGHLVMAKQGCTLPLGPPDNTISGMFENSLTCTTPDLSDEGLNPSPYEPFIANVTIKFNKKVLMPMSHDGQIELPVWEILYYPDPILNDFQDKLFKLDPNSKSILIYGEYLDLVSQKEDVSVMVGNQPCIIQELESTFISCQVPESLQDAGNDAGIYEVQVTMGDSQPHNVGYLQVPPKEGLANSSVVVTIIGILILLAIVILIVLVGIRRYRKSKRGAHHIPIDETTVGFTHMGGTEEVQLASQGLHRNNTYLTNPGSPTNGAMPLMHAPLLEQINNELAAEISQVLIHEEKIALGKVLGQGHFGCVFAGKLHQDGEEQQVAIKSLHQGTLNEITNFLREGIMMKDFKHRNVLTLIGVCIINETNMPYVVLPFMKNGDILTFVRDPSNELTARQLLEFCRQIAEGMMYLSGLKFVHRDLAARNCMLDGDMVVKVADFGLSRDIYERDYYSAKDRSAKLPVRWMAMECLERNVYNTRTDVWSFGVVMWELLTRGVVPYPSVDNVEILKYLHGGRRLPQPEHCPDHVYEVMLSCWSVSPIDRPSFCLLVDNLNSILTVKPEDPADEEKADTYINIPGTS